MRQGRNNRYRYLTELSEESSAQRLLPHYVVVIVRLQGRLQVPALRYVRKAQQLLPFFAEEGREKLLNNLKQN